MAPRLSVTRDFYLTVHEDLLHLSRVRTTARFLRNQIERDQPFLHGLDICFGARFVMVGMPVVDWKCAVQGERVSVSYDYGGRRDIHNNTQAIHSPFYPS